VQCGADIESMPDLTRVEQDIRGGRIKRILQTVEREVYLVIVEYQGLLVEVSVVCSYLLAFYSTIQHLEVAGPREG
jgi:hypothetical protein